MNQSERRLCGSISAKQLYVLYDVPFCQTSVGTAFAFDDFCSVSSIPGQGKISSVQEKGWQAHSPSQLRKSSVVEQVSIASAYYAGDNSCSTQTALSASTMNARTRSSELKRSCKATQAVTAVKSYRSSKQTAVPPLPLEILQCIFDMACENYNLPAEVTPFNGQDAYFGTCPSYLSAPCISLPRVCRSLRRAGEKALYTTVRVQGSNMPKLLRTLRARNELGMYVRCIDVRCRMLATTIRADDYIEG